MSEGLPKRYQGKTIEEAISKARSELGVDKDNLKYEVVDKGGECKGLLRKKQKPCIIEVKSLLTESEKVSKEEEKNKKDESDSLEKELSKTVKDLEGQLEKNIDGYFKIEEEEDYEEGDKVYLTVYPAENEGKEVKWMDVKKQLEKYGYKILSEGLIVEVVRNAESKAVDVSQYLEEIRIDGTFEIKVEEKNMKAVLKVTLPQGKGEKVTFEEVKNNLNDKGIVHGLKWEVIEEAVNDGTGGDYVVIAEGIFPEKGKDAQIQLNFERKEAKPVIKEDGTVDYYNVENVTNVNKGDLLATKIPPEEGTPGTNVYGEEVPPEPPKDKMVKAGKKTVFDEENLVLIADEAGQVTMNEDGMIQVLPVYEVSGDLDLSIGNIDFVGTVVVKGGVKSNLTIRAAGDVEIGKSAENCFIEAEGNVYIRGGIQGKQKGYVKCAGEVTSKFIENAYVEAKGDVRASEAIMHSYVRGKNIYVTQGKRGLLVGGRTVAEEEVHAKTIGSSLATSTTIEVGFAPELRDRIEELREETKKINENMEKTKKAINILEKMKAAQGKLPDDKESMLVRLQRTETHLTEDIKEIEEEKEELEKKLEESQSGKVIVGNLIYPGVKIVIGNAVRNNDEEKKKVTFYLNKEGEIRAE